MSIFPQPMPSITPSFYQKASAAAQVKADHNATILTELAKFSSQINHTHGPKISEKTAATMRDAVTMTSQALQGNSKALITTAAKTPNAGTLQLKGYAIALLVPQSKSTGLKLRLASQILKRQIEHTALNEIKKMDSNAAQKLASNIKLKQLAETQPYVFDMIAAGSTTHNTLGNVIKAELCRTSGFSASYNDINKGTRINDMKLKIQTASSNENTAANQRQLKVNVTLDLGRNTVAASIDVK